MKSLSLVPQKDKHIKVCEDVKKWCNVTLSSGVLHTLTPNFYAFCFGLNFRRLSRVKAQIFSLNYLRLGHSIYDYHTAYSSHSAQAVEIKSKDSGTRNRDALYRDALYQEMILSQNRWENTVISGAASSNGIFDGFGNFFGNRGLDEGI